MTSVLSSSTAAKCRPAAGRTAARADDGAAGRHPGQDAVSLGVHADPFLAPGGDRAPRQQLEPAHPHHHAVLQQDNPETDSLRKGRKEAAGGAGKQDTHFKETTHTHKKKQDTLGIGPKGRNDRDPGPLRKNKTKKNNPQHVLRYTFIGAEHVFFQACPAAPPPHPPLSSPLCFCSRFPFFAQPAAAPSARHPAKLLSGLRRNRDGLNSGSEGRARSPKHHPRSSLRWPTGVRPATADVLGEGEGGDKGRPLPPPRCWSLAAFVKPKGAPLVVPRLLFFLSSCL